MSTEQPHFNQQLLHDGHLEKFFSVTYCRVLSDIQLYLQNRFKKRRKHLLNLGSLEKDCF